MFELIHTSAPSGLRPGATGFCSVAWTQGIPTALAAQLEQMCGYAHLPGIHDPAMAPVAFVHRHCQVSGRRFSVLSRIADAGLDYTGRSNKIAHHLALSEAELTRFGPASLLLAKSGLVSEWSGEPRQLHPRPPEFHPISGKRADTWGRMTGDAGWAGAIATAFLANPGKSVALIYAPPSHDILALVGEVIELLPESERWKFTFNTYFDSLAPGEQCFLRCMVAGSESAARYSAAALIALNLSKPGALPACPAGELVDVARTGLVAQAPVVRNPVEPSSPGKAPEPAASPNMKGAPMPARFTAPVHPVNPRPAKKFVLPESEPDSVETSPKFDYKLYLSVAVASAAALSVAAYLLLRDPVSGSKRPSPTVYVNTPDARVKAPAESGPVSPPTATPPGAAQAVADQAAAKAKEEEGERKRLTDEKNLQKEREAATAKAKEDAKNAFKLYLTSKGYPEGTALRKFHAAMELVCGTVPSDIKVAPENVRFHLLAEELFKKVDGIEDITGTYPYTCTLAGCECPEFSVSNKGEREMAPAPKNRPTWTLCISEGESLKFVWMPKKDLDGKSPDPEDWSGRLRLLSLITDIEVTGEKVVLWEPDYIKGPMLRNKFIQLDGKEKKIVIIESSIKYLDLLLRWGKVTWKPCEKGSPEAESWAEKIKNKEVLESWVKGVNEALRDIDSQQSQWEKCVNEYNKAQEEANELNKSFVEDLKKAKDDAAKEVVKKTRGDANEGARKNKIKMNDADQKLGAAELKIKNLTGIDFKRGKHNSTTVSNAVINQPF